MALAHPAPPVAAISPAELHGLVARAGLELNPGQLADLVLVWRQLAGLVAAIPRARPLRDDQAFVFRLPPPPAAPARTPAPRTPAPAKSRAAPAPSAAGRAGPKDAARQPAAQPARPGTAKPKLAASRAVKPSAGKRPTGKPPTGKARAAAATRKKR